MKTIKSKLQSVGNFFVLNYYTNSLKWKVRIHNSNNVTKANKSTNQILLEFKMANEKQESIFFINLHFFVVFSFHLDSDSTRKKKNNRRTFLEKYIFNGFTCLKMWYARMLCFGRWPRRIRTVQVQIEKLFLLRKLKRIKVKHINRRINKTYENNIWVVSSSISFHLCVCPVYAKQKIKYSVVFNNKWDDICNHWYESHLTGDRWKRAFVKTALMWNQRWSLRIFSYGLWCAAHI